MIELYQREECVDCARVRRALGDLMLDFTARQVQPAVAGRDALERATGQREVPVLMDHAAGMVVTEADDIIAYLHETYGREKPAP